MSDGICEKQIDKKKKIEILCGTGSTQTSTHVSVKNMSDQRLSSAQTMRRKLVSLKTHDFFNMFLCIFDILKNKTY